MMSRVISCPGRLRQVLLVLALAIASLPVTLAAQSVSGTILGSVTDPTGAVIAIRSPPWLRPKM